jgi:peroxiredoxin (alkyl hydroperoxide reductase subunit C)
MYAHVGGKAPSWSAEAYVKDELEPVAVDVPGDGSWLVLFFYPRDFTFVCPTELAAFEELRLGFEEAGARIVAASTDSWWVHRAWFTTSPWLGDVAYPVIADTSQELALRYGVLLDDGSALRATFVIDPDGVVRHAAATDANVGRSAPETLRILQALQTGELCPADWRPGRATLQAA